MEPFVTKTGFGHRLRFGFRNEKGLSFGEFFSGDYNNREYDGIPWPYLEDGRINPKYEKFCKGRKRYVTD